MVGASGSAGVNAGRSGTVSPGGAELGSVVPERSVDGWWRTVTEVPSNVACAMKYEPTTQAANTHERAVDQPFYGDVCKSAGQVRRNRQSVSSPRVRTQRAPASGA